FNKESVSTTGASISVSTADKGKAIIQESDLELTSTKLQQRQERVGYEAAVRLQEQLDEKERQRIPRIQAEEKDKYSEAKKVRLLVDLINQRKRHFAKQRAEERRNKPLTQDHQRNYMSNYVKHMGSHTLQQLKRLSFDELKNLFEATMKRVKTFTPMESDFDITIPKIANESSKRVAEEELEQESSKRQKTREISEAKEKEDDELTQKGLQQMMMVPMEEVYVELQMNIKFRGGLLEIRGFYNLLLLVQVSTAGYKSFYCWIQEFLLLVEETIAGEE
nr:hypothetical protein [Tanacetum cinerariifolium]